MAEPASAVGPDSLFRWTRALGTALRTLKKGAPMVMYLTNPHPSAGLECTEIHNVTSEESVMHRALYLALARDKQSRLFRRAYGHYPISSRWKLCTTK